MGMPKKKTICIDFDGVLAHYDGWKGEDHLGDPINGMKGLVRDLKFKHGYIIIIYSCRGSVQIDKWCKRWGIYYDYININPELPTDNIGKPAADVYLDDRAITFSPRGGTERMMYKILNFHTWKEKDKQDDE